MTETIGFIGLGNIGAPATSRLLANGYKVVGFDIKANEELRAAGMTVADEVGDVAGCPIIIQSLPGAAALHQTLDGLLPNLKSGQIIADISSYRLEDKEAAAERVAAKGAVFLDCEVSGLPFQIAERTAALFCAGDQAAVDACMPVFDIFTARQFYLGAFGLATKMKLIANYMVSAHNLIAAEALSLGSAAGIDPAQMVEVLKPSAAGSATFANKAPLMVSREFGAGRGPFRHMFGYLARVKQLAENSGMTSATPVLDSVRGVYKRAEEENRHDHDIAEIIEIIEAMRETDRA